MEEPMLLDLTDSSRTTSGLAYLRAIPSRVNHLRGPPFGLGLGHALGPLSCASCSTAPELPRLGIATFLLDSFTGRNIGAGTAAPKPRVGHVVGPCAIFGGTHKALPSKLRPAA